MDRPKVFVIMPFSDDFFESYELIKGQFEGRFVFTNAGDEDNQQNILADIITPIYEADVVLADLTGLNPNVMYELGIAHSFNKKTIIITRDDLETLPFDLKQYRVKGYSTHFKQFHELLIYLEKNLIGAIDGSVVFNNPVNDFLDKNHISYESLFSQEKINVNIPDDEKGFIDFLADIEDNTQKMTESISGMTDDLKDMNAGINECTNEINRVKKSGGSGTASFIRKQSKKAADCISKYNEALRECNINISTLWSENEKNILGLLESPFTAQEENRASLISYLRTLSKTQAAIRESNQSVIQMKKASLSNLGIERSMNQSIRFLDEDLATYLSITEQMDASIDRILRKSRLIVGDIDFSQEVEDDA